MHFLRFLLGIFTFAVALAMSSCDSKSVNNQTVVVDINKVENGALPFFVDEVVPLETFADNLLSTQLKIRKYQEGYLIKDERQSGGNATKSGIHHFDGNGSYLGEIVSIGEGPDELANVKDFIVDREKVEVLVSKDQETLIEVFSLSGERETSNKFGFLADSFTKKSNGNYLFYAGYNAPLVKHRLIETNAKGKVLQSYLSNEYTGALIPVQERNFSVYDGNVYFKEAFNNHVYMVSDTLNATFRLDSSPFTFPAEFWEMDFMEGFQLINEKGFAFVEDYLESNKWVLFYISIQKQGEMTRKLMLINKVTGKSKIETVTEESLWYKPVGFDENRGDFMFLVHPITLKKAKESGVLSLDLSGIQEDDNPVLVFTSVEE